MMDLDGAKKKRDRRLRRRLLNTLQLARSLSPRGGLGGRVLADNVDSVVGGGNGFENDMHTLALIRDLVNAGYAEEEMTARRRGQSFGLDYVFFKITAKGSSLWEEALPPDPMIDDDRVTED